MVVIRLARAGAKKRPFYHIVAADKRMPRDGRFIEKIGYFNPIANGGETRISIKHERIEHWISVGAQPSDRVKSLIKEEKLTAEAVARGETVPAKKAKKTKKAKAAESQAAQTQAAEVTTEAKAKTETDTAAKDESGETHNESKES